MKVVIDDCRLERMDVYTDPLNDKIKRQAEEITRLLRENAELKERMQKDIDYLCDICNNHHNLDAARADGAEKAWKLALKLRYMDYEDKVECFGLEYDGKEKWIEIMEKYTYPEAATKVEAWEKSKEEIHVGDVVKIHEGNENDICVICITSDKKYYNAIDKYGALYPMLTRETISKTGRHIDVDAWLAQIGGEE